ncbi:hypothetical protein AMAG_09288 [Allomyces macrogynus ATCC 38327]|uniref:Uncharacterized protein n=1 Tax=Allomyces macrogynus (strain ATCC 38327) TaxID=578462 RepID=A0A0L0SP32_ALLM3|nr:hypothetical protein AMAG_09288 [Allomyces macrogynus ATCC 38327]|eukprot:KNE64252.1 hypothetical protein AMAG_09288 [Allomyces macrogynus ATCC 38327]
MTMASPPTPTAPAAAAPAAPEPGQLYYLATDAWRTLAAKTVPAILMQVDEPAKSSSRSGKLHHASKRDRTQSQAQPDPLAVAAARVHFFTDLHNAVRCLQSDLIHLMRSTPPGSTPSLATVQLLINVLIDQWKYHTKVERALRVGDLAAIAWVLALDAGDPTPWRALLPANTPSVEAIFVEALRQFVDLHKQQNHTSKPPFRWIFAALCPASEPSILGSLIAHARTAPSLPTSTTRDTRVVYSFAPSTLRAVQRLFRELCRAPMFGRIANGMILIPHPDVAAQILDTVVADAVTTTSTTSSLSRPLLVSALEGYPQLRDPPLGHATAPILLRRMPLTDLIQPPFVHVVAQFYAHPELRGQARHVYETTLVPRFSPDETVSLILALAQARSGADASTWMAGFLPPILDLLATMVNGSSDQPAPPQRAHAHAIMERVLAAPTLTEHLCHQLRTAGPLLDALQAATSSVVDDRPTEPSKIASRPDPCPHDDLSAADARDMAVIRRVPLLSLWYDQWAKRGAVRTESVQTFLAIPARNAVFRAFQVQSLTQQIHQRAVFSDDRDVAETQLRRMATAILFTDHAVPHLLARIVESTSAEAARKAVEGTQTDELGGLIATVVGMDVCPTILTTIPRFDCDRDTSVATALTASIDDDPNDPIVPLPTRAATAGIPVCPRAAALLGALVTQDATWLALLTKVTQMRDPTSGTALWTYLAPLLPNPVTVRHATERVPDIDVSSLLPAYLTLVPASIAATFAACAHPDARFAASLRVLLARIIAAMAPTTFYSSSTKAAAAMAAGDRDQVEQLRAAIIDQFLADFALLMARHAEAEKVVAALNAIPGGSGGADAAVVQEARNSYDRTHRQLLHLTQALRYLALQLPALDLGRRGGAHALVPVLLEVHLAQRHDHGVFPNAYLVPVIADLGLAVADWTAMLAPLLQLRPLHPGTLFPADTSAADAAHVAPPTISQDPLDRGMGAVYAAIARAASTSPAHGVQLPVWLVLLESAFYVSPALRKAFLNMVESAVPVTRLAPDMYWVLAQRVLTVVEARARFDVWWGAVEAVLREKFPPPAHVLPAVQMPPALHGGNRSRSSTAGGGGMMGYPGPYAPPPPMVRGAMSPGYAPPMGAMSPGYAPQYAMPAGVMSPQYGAGPPAGAMSPGFYGLGGPPPQGRPY